MLFNRKPKVSDGSTVMRAFMRRQQKRAVMGPAKKFDEPVQMTKQVIVIRKDLGMRRGKEIAQGAHASMMWLATAVQQRTEMSAAQKHWLYGSFTKVCVRVDSEAEFQKVIDKAHENGVMVHVCTDKGTTEFHGVPTRTAAAIGPDMAARVDAVTGDLKLY